MSFTIGRASLPVDPSSARWSGDQLTITGWISPTTANDTNHAYALRQQLLGLVNNPDEQVFPCTFSVDPNWDGYYYVNSVNVSGDPGLMEIQGRMPYSIQLTRLAAGYARPLTEALVTVLTRTNAHGVVVPAGVVNGIGATAGYANESAASTSTGSPSFTSWTSADGAGYYLTVQSPVSTFVWQWFQRAADYYKSCAKIEVKYGSTWYAIQGMQIPDAVGMDWRLSNGLTRVYPTNAGGNGRFTVERWNGAAWVGREFTMTQAAGVALAVTTDPTSGGAVSPKVILNTPDRVVLRLRQSITGAGGQIADFCLSSAASYIEVAMSTTNSSAIAYGAATSAVVAMTAFTGGARATANDANGLRCLISTPLANTTDLVNGKVYPTVGVGLNSVCISPDYQTNLAGAADTSTRDSFLTLAPMRRAVVVR